MIISTDLRLRGDGRPCARAVLRDRPLLTLDEATSHLDSEREEGILDAIEAIAAKKAVLVVAHRPLPLSVRIISS
ncbi:hypothetical protein PSQ90_14820 [Devosia rhodophyticola]|uniref:ABC transporter ATP-binding protein n=1 Tax=Devosia rhodophyticola TaxID=3026423 RepID=A0ABY7YW40_9HYPH|nr:hypothetical protein [Devosia rhodophyticola]WDR05531.1 hypothetical protein PSQ90_14820 [Devosia rhodophyticola]